MWRQLEDRMARSLLDIAEPQEEDQEKTNFLDYTAAPEPVVEGPAPIHVGTAAPEPKIKSSVDKMYAKHFLGDENAEIPEPFDFKSVEPSSDIALGVIHGAREAGQNLLDFGFNVSKTTTNFLGIEASDQGAQLPEVKEPTTTGGRIASGLSEIIIDTVLLSKGSASLGNQLIKRLPFFRGAKAMKTGDLASSTIGSIATTEIAIEPNDPNLANLLAEYPATKGFITDILATDASDPEIINMLRHHLLDIGIGVSATKVMGWMGKGFKEVTKTTKNKVAEWAINNKKDYVPMKAFEEAFEEGPTSFTQSLQRTLAKYKQYGKDTFIYNVFDAKHGLALLGKNAERLKKGRAWRAYQEATLLENTSATIEISITEGAPRWVGGLRDEIKFDGPSMKNILKTFEEAEGRDQIPNLFKYMAAERAKALHLKTGKSMPEILGSKGITVEAVDNWIAFGRSNKNIQEATAGLQEVNNTMLQFAVDSGILSPKSKDMLLETNAIFVPFYRIMRDDSPFGTVATETARAPARALKKKLTGVDLEKGELKIANLLENTQKNYASIIKASLENRAKQEVYDLIKQMPDYTEHWAKPAGKKPQGFQVNRDELERMLINKSGQDIDLSDIPDEFLTVFGWQRQFDRNSNVDIVFRDGVAEQWEIIDPFVLKAMNDITPKGVRILEGPTKIAKEIFGAPKRLITFGVTSDPSFFGGSNLSRDAFQAEVLSVHARAGIPLLNTARGLHDNLFDRLGYKEFIGAGGGFGATVARAEQQAGLDPRIIKAYYTPYGINVIDTPKKLYENWENIISSFENATRRNEFNRLMASGKYSQREAAFMARQVATDFSMHGGSEFIRFMTSVTPFLNAGLQGLYRTARQFGSPAFAGAKQATRSGAILKLFAWSVGPHIVDWYLNKDNPDWQSLPEEVRLSNVMFDIGGGNWFALPNAFELGYIGAVTKSMLTEMSNTHGRLFTEEFVNFTMETFRLNLTPQILSPIINLEKQTGLLLNKTHRGTPITPRRFEDVEKQEQFTPYTSEAAKRFASISKGTPWELSPIEAEYLFTAYFGAMGTYANAAADTLLRAGEGLPERPASGAYEQPIARRFIVDFPYNLTVQERDTYKILERATEVKKTFNTMIKSSSAHAKSKAQSYLNPNDPEEKEEMQQLFGVADAVRTTVQDFNKSTITDLNSILESNVSGEEKRLKIKEIEAKRAEFFADLYGSLSREPGISRFLGLPEEPLFPEINNVVNQLDKLLGIKRKE